MTLAMSLEIVLARVAEINSLIAPPPIRPPASAAVPAGQGGTFAAMLNGATASAAPGPGGVPFTASVGAPGPPGAGGAMVAIAAAEVGQAEAPPGSNDSARIAQYRQATAGAPGPGPWCAYFVSWVARQAGTPIGEHGQGFGSVDAVYAWAQRSGRAVPIAAGPPRPGDLVVWDEHIGIVEGVGPDGSIHTIEGNSSDRVSRRTHGPGADGAIGYVRMS